MSNESNGSMPLPYQRSSARIPRVIRYLVAHRAALRRRAWLRVVVMGLGFVATLILPFATTLACAWLAIGVLALLLVNGVTVSNDLVAAGVFGAALIGAVAPILMMGWPTYDCLMQLGLSWLPGRVRLSSNLIAELPQWGSEINVHDLPMMDYLTMDAIGHPQATRLVLKGYLEGLVALAALIEQRPAWRSRSVVMISHFFAHGRLLQRFGFDVQPVSAWDRARFLLARDRLSIEHWMLTGEERPIRVEDLRRASIAAERLVTVAPRLIEWSQELAERAAKNSAL